MAEGKFLNELEALTIDVQDNFILAISNPDGVSPDTAYKVTVAQLTGGIDPDQINAKSIRVNDGNDLQYVPIDQIAITNSIATVSATDYSKIDPGDTILWGDDPYPVGRTGTVIKKTDPSTLYLSFMEDTPGLQDFKVVKPHLFLGTMDPNLFFPADLQGNRMLLTQEVTVMYSMVAAKGMTSLSAIDPHTVEQGTSDIWMASKGGDIILDPVSLGPGTTTVHIGGQPTVTYNDSTTVINSSTTEIRNDLYSKFIYNPVGAAEALTIKSKTNNLILATEASGNIDIDSVGNITADSVKMTFTTTSTASDSFKVVSAGGIDLNSDGISTITMDSASSITLTAATTLTLSGTSTTVIGNLIMDAVSGGDITLNSSNITGTSSNIKTTTGNIQTDEGDLKAPAGQITAKTGNITSSLGAASITASGGITGADIEATSTLKAKNLTITGSFSVGTLSVTSLGATNVTASNLTKSKDITSTGTLKIVGTKTEATSTVTGDVGYQFGKDSGAGIYGIKAISSQPFVEGVESDINFTGTYPTFPSTPKLFLPLIQVIGLTKGRWNVPNFANQRYWAKKAVRYFKLYTDGSFEAEVSGYYRIYFSMLIGTPGLKFTTDSYLYARLAQLLDLWSLLTTYTVTFSSAENGTSFINKTAMFTVFMGKGQKYRLQFAHSFDTDVSLFTAESSLNIEAIIESQFK